MTASAEAEDEPATKLTIKMFYGNCDRAATQPLLPPPIQDVMIRFFSKLHH
jgi:hypothetical protein